MFIEANSSHFIQLIVYVYPSKVSCPAARHGGGRGERRYSSYSFLTSALEGGEWSASRPGRALPPGKGPPVPIVQEAGWAPEPVWTQGLEEKSSASVGNRTPIVQPVVRHKTARATAIQAKWENQFMQLRKYLR
jgi:hypothetical protein